MPPASGQKLSSAGPDDGGLAAVRAGISDYYTARIRKFGATPLGVDWTCQPTQELRFVQLLTVCDFASAFSLNDLGCGYGALLSFWIDITRPAPSTILEPIFRQRWCEGRDDHTVTVPMFHLRKAASARAPPIIRSPAEFSMFSWTKPGMSGRNLSRPHSANSTTRAGAALPRTSSLPD